MTWEYKVDLFIDARTSNALETHLNKLGADGWELIVIQSASTNAGNYSHWLLFKRPAPAATSKPQGKVKP